MTEDEIKQKLMVAVQDLPAAVAQGIIHPDYRHNDPLLPEELISTMTNADAYAEGANVFRRSFPDLTTEAVWVMVKDDKSAVRWFNTGTFTGEPFYGVQPNGKKVEFAGMTMWRWENGQVVEGMTLFDNIGFNAQINS